MPLGMEVGLGPGYIVLDGDPAPERGTAPQFSAHVCCGQTVGLINMPLGKEVDLGPGRTVLDGDPVPPPLRKIRAQQLLAFRHLSIGAKRLDGSRCHLVRRQASAQARLC